ncbi:unnamed protein product [Heligmosomoides polygyrus]|uniref:Uncharacterized protein n=1 Tax=Heligmosomoides polygyrus TaxID=6339 RepID=A0A183GCK3_HELPZ|nr:unnamed protein product [Heligmosomoides polygyrus]
MQPRAILRNPMRRLCVPRAGNVCRSTWDVVAAEEAQPPPGLHSGNCEPERLDPEDRFSSSRKKLLESEEVIPSCDKRPLGKQGSGPEVETRKGRGGVGEDQ